MHADTDADEVADAHRRECQYRYADRDLRRKGGALGRVRNRLLRLRHEERGEINHLPPHFAAQDGADDALILGRQASFAVLLQRRPQVVKPNLNSKMGIARARC
jgi:hypothetical protein